MLGAGVVLWTRSSVRAPDGASTWGSTSPCWEVGWSGAPGSWLLGAQSRCDFPARTWKGRELDRGRLEGPCPAAPRPESSEAGISGTARWPGKQAFGVVGVLVGRSRCFECATPQTPLASCSDAKDSRGHTAPGSISARQPPPGREVAGPRRSLRSLCPFPHSSGRGWGLGTMGTRRGEAG